MSFQLIFFIVISFFSLISCDGKSKPLYNKSDCDTAVVFFKKLSQAKVNYERAVFHENLINVSRDSVIYFKMLSVLRQNKQMNIECIKQILENENGANVKVYVEFEYYPKYLSRIPPCGFMKFNSFLKLMLYNLEMVDKGPLICEEGSE